MNYEQYHKKGGTYEFPVEVFDNFLDEKEELEKEKRQLKGSLQTHEILLRVYVEENQKLKEQLQQKEDVINKITNYCKFQIEKEQDKFPKPIESEEWLKGRISAFEEILDNKGE